MGWNVYREETFERPKERGIILENAELTPCPASLSAWDSLTDGEKRLSARMMEVFAAYGEQVDYEVGPVLDYVKMLPGADNAMIIYIVGDNGASAEGGFGPGRVRRMSQEGCESLDSPNMRLRLLAHAENTMPCHAPDNGPPTG
ncbi:MULTISPECIES: sulfatase-like hydrolase/transferase [Paracoccus]|uniref:Sulfatase-like hydrolase/transferase n=1 Tax=Paracoccus aurantius TaxID=3073814 RepID=A0ABU2HX80_9RHOB|nr:MULTISPECIES: sulfatase-like hydrolase/transferase [Paracoccus]MDS9469623.1 sulfatase-like hydrolase/transferase [Paracoccus sp. MBLB3053]